MLVGAPWYNAPVSFEKLAEKRITEAIENGEFDRLSKAGQPVDLDSYFAMPEDVRMAYSILKNANCVPEEVTLLNEIARLQAVMQAACDPKVRDAASVSLRDQQTRLEILKEQRRKTQSPASQKQHSS